MKTEWRRAASVPVPVKSVRRSMRFSCGKGGLRDAITRFGRNYGLVNVDGSTQDSEIVRLAVLTALTRMANKPAHVATTVLYAVRVQRPFLVAQLGRLLTMENSTSEAKRSRRTGKYGAVRRNVAKVTFDNTIGEALEQLAPHYQDEIGRVRDTKMVADLCASGLSDPDIHSIARQYVERTKVLRERLAQAYQYVRAAIAEAVNEDQGASMKRAG